MGSQPPEFSPADNPAADCDSPAVRSLTFFFLPAFNAWLLLCPYTLSFDWSMEAIPLITSIADPRNLASFALYAVLALLAMTVLMSLRRRRAGEDAAGGETTTSGDVTVMGLALMLLPFLPATNLFFYVGFVVAERILYIPSMGACLLVGWGAHLLHARARTARARRLLHGALIILFLLFAARTWSRNRDWATEENLYRSGIAINPPKGKCSYHLPFHLRHRCTAHTPTPLGLRALSSSRNTFILLHPSRILQSTHSQRKPTHRYPQTKVTHKTPQPISPSLAFPQTPPPTAHDLP